MCQIAVRVTRGRHALVHLRNMHVFPRHCFAGQDAKHLPRDVTATDRHDETSARSDGLAGFGGNKLCSRCGRSIGVRVNLNSHTTIL
jgi:hypothetical protein